MVSVGATGGNNPILQIVTASTSALATLSTIMPIGDTIPVNTDGTEVLTVTITPKHASNILYFLFTALVGTPDSTTIITALFQDTTANALACSQTTAYTQADETPIFVYKMTAGTTSATTFKIRMGPQVSLGPLYLNGTNAAARLFGGVASTKLTVYEYQV